MPRGPPCNPKAISAHLRSGCRVTWSCVPFHGCRAVRPTQQPAFSSSPTLLSPDSTPLYVASSGDSSGLPRPLPVLTLREHTQSLHPSLAWSAVPADHALVVAAGPSPHRLLLPHPEIRAWECVSGRASPLPFPSGTRPLWHRWWRPASRAGSVCPCA